jgi:hypothetical protein
MYHGHIRIFPFSTTILAFPIIIASLSLFHNVSQHVVLDVGMNGIVEKHRFLSVIKNVHYIYVCVVRSLCEFSKIKKFVSEK